MTTVSPSIRPHHPNTMNQRSGRTLYQCKDVSGIFVLAVIGKRGDRVLYEYPFPWPYILVRRKVDQLERDGLVDNTCGFGNCPDITPKGIEAILEWGRERSL